MSCNRYLVLLIQQGRAPFCRLLFVQTNLQKQFSELPVHRCQGLASSSDLGVGPTEQQ